ncbi:hypothetical protein GCM10010260_29730 [Streptomyces filipinensis]|uniref:Uncharacterized protein n=1 Tax=Streptomyces filipinensis TaxID=66887 RepID=A0A918IAX9_9ACTN|nr:hypothetical protein GCM10010260_29730 [Streptomyces filipinensis]
MVSWVPGIGIWPRPVESGIWRIQSGLLTLVRLLNAGVDGPGHQGRSKADAGAAVVATLSAARTAPSAEIVPVRRRGV